MTDPRDPDLDFGRDLRRIADWADPVATPAPEELVPGTLGALRTPSPARRLLAVAAGLLLLGLAVGLVVARGGGADEEPVAPVAEPDQLLGVEWQIDSVAIADAAPSEPPPDSEAVIRFSGSEVTGRACNHFRGEATVGVGTVVFGDEVMSTSMACTDPAITAVEGAVLQLVRSGEGTWSITDGVLVLEANGVRLVGRPKADAFPTPDLEELAASDGSTGAEWHFGFEQLDEGEYRTYLTWEGRAGPGQPFGAAGMAVDPEVSLDAMWVDHVEGGLFPFGTLPPGTERAVFTAEDGTETELRVHRLPEGRPVFGQPVAAAGGEVRAIGPAGEVLETSRGLGSAAG